METNLKINNNKWINLLHLNSVRDNSKEKIFQISNKIRPETIIKKLKIK